MLRIILSIGLIALFPLPSWATEKTLLHRLIHSSELSLTQIYPEADMFCVVSEYKTKRQALEKYGIAVSFWNNTAVLENKFLIVLLKNREIIAEQMSGSIVEGDLEKSVFIIPINVCVDEFDMKVKIERKMSVPVHNTVAGKRIVQIPSQEYLTVDFNR